MENGCSYSYSIFHFSFSMENENNGMYTDREPTGLFPVLVGLLIQNGGQVPKIHP